MVALTARKLAVDLLLQILLHVALLSIVELQPIAAHMVRAQQQQLLLVVLTQLHRLLRGHIQLRLQALGRAVLIVLQRVLGRVVLIVHHHLHEVIPLQVAVHLALVVRQVRQVLHRFRLLVLLQLILVVPRVALLPLLLVALLVQAVAQVHHRVVDDVKENRLKRYR